MKKSILFLSLFFLFQMSSLFAQSIELPTKLYLCDSGSIDLDGTVINTSDPSITYQWYYSVSSNVQVTIANEISGATNSMYTVTTATMGNGYYKVVATMSDMSTITDEVRIYGMVDVPTYEYVQCIDNYTIQELVESYYLLEGTLNIEYTYHYSLNDANAGINSIGQFDGIPYTWQLYLRIEENNGGCVDVLTINVEPFNQPLYAGNVSNMGSCSPDSTTNIFDLTINDTDIINGQTWAEVSYFISFNDAWNLTNPIANPNSYTAVSPNQTIYARIYDINNPNTFCDITDSTTQFQLLSAPEPTPNTTINYIVCDDTSGTANDNIGEFDLTSKNSLVLAGLSASQFNVSYHTTISDAQNDTNPIASPANYIATSGEVVYIRIESNLHTECVQISLLNLFVQDTCDDISVSLVSYWSAPRPGFSYKNKLIVKNKGESTVSSGTVEFFKDALLIYNNVTGVTGGNTLTPTVTGFTLDFLNLLPGETEEIIIDMSVPPSATLGDVLTSTVTYTTASTDVNVENNSSSLSEIIIGSYDPNDITESHGPEILHSTFTSDDYLYYTIRFQNVGTASAVNITIDNALDVKLDKTTFEMLSSSHTNTVERVFDKLTWQFANINLADSTSDEPNSHGYVYYRIKPLAGYNVGDIIPNAASIVFDFNTPIVTNTFDTEFVAALGVQDHFKNVEFLMMPNPASNELSLVFESTESVVEVAIYDILGKLVLSKTAEQTAAVSLNISLLDSGIYFVKIRDSKGKLGVKKLIKK